MKIKSYYIEQRHINDIKPGDTVLRDGKLLTVTEKDINDNCFIGRTLFGDSYNLGYAPVSVAIFI
ncbi:TPA: hypothetical protein KNG82_002188 [Escherichia coli]|nr:hypothetical protein [Escherichia coli]